MYAFELTTLAFTITSEGMLVVNQKNLDRDPPSPSTFRFQVGGRLLVSRTPIIASFGGRGVLNCARFEDSRVVA